MKAGSRFLNAVSAVALSASVVASGAGVTTLVSATAAEAAVIQKVDVRGAGRAGSEAVRDNITITPGKSFSPADIDQSVKQLYATGYFSDVHISVSGSTLVVTVSENQLINARLSSTATARSRTTSWRVSFRRMPRVPITKRRSRGT